MSDQERSLELGVTFQLLAEDSLVLRRHLGTAEGEGDDEGEVYNISMTTGSIMVEQPGGRMVSVPMQSIVQQAVKALKILQAVEELMTDHGSVLEGREADVDELVHDLSNLEGSNVNNAGIEQQLLFLGQQLGAEEMLRLVRATFGISGT